MAPLCLLLVVLVAWMQVLGRGGRLLGPYDAAYTAAALESFVPLCVLALAETLVILSGRGGIASPAALPPRGLRPGFAGVGVLPEVMCTAARSKRAVSGRDEVLRPGMPGRPVGRNAGPYSPVSWLRR
ncbi:hypothetical protein Arub01_19080 [Actinomadura rubrobrunea]|uniref:Uncharacterized protein n=1 Tax=Actinomadura rubrobrunea TaxID=115335 RepID=A0A9W6UU99_9ACTN|nr:hypothetical protein [Actinomadura rubrobrunea]GLW63664.1 hypothetical protein Arub01_19080 [Actinomadura rubrobrunea]